MTPARPPPARNGEQTPTPRAKRLPRILSGTKEAAERKKEKQRERQARRRERIRQQRMRRAPSSSSESDKDQDHPVSDDGGGGAGAFDDAEDDDQGPEPAPFHEPGLEDDMMHARETVTEQAPTTYRPSVREDDDAKVHELVRGVVRLKVKSKVSDAALDAMFNLFYEKKDTLVLIKEKSLLPTNYTNGVRPYATDRLPEFPCTLLLKEEDPARGTFYRKLENLKTVPAEFFNLPATSRTKLLRQETHVSLTDIKKMYKDAHGDSEEVKQQLLNCDISADGVAESKSGARTFVVVSIRIGTCIYVYRIFNHLIGINESKANALELLRYIGVCSAVGQLRIKLVPF